MSTLSRCKFLTKSTSKMTLLITQGLILLVHPKRYTFSFKNFMNLENLAENIYNDNVSLDAAKQEQRRMKNLIRNFINYNPVKDNYKNKNFIIL